MYSENDWRDYLAHSGVLGQKWHVRNGPPYPLKPSQHSASEQKAGWRRSLPSNKMRGNKNAGLISKLYVKSVNALDKKYTKERGATDPKTGLPTKTKELTMEEDAKRVNVKQATGELGFNMNCAFCSITYDLRRRGFDVKAGALNDGMYESDIAGMYKNSGGFKLIKSAKNTSLKVRSEVIEKEFIKQGEGARGILTVSWDSGGAHAMGYEVSGGKLKIVEAQHGFIYSDPSGVFNRCESDSIQYLRTDNIEPNYTKIKKKGVVE